MMRKSFYTVLVLVIGFAVVAVSSRALVKESKESRTVYLVKFDRTLDESILDSVRKLPGVEEAKPLIKTNNLYFSRIAEVHGSELGPLLRKLKYVENVEISHDVSIFGIIPSTGPHETNDSFFGYQWGLKVKDQIVSRDLTDVHSIQFENDTSSSIDFVRNGEVQFLDKEMKRDAIVAIIDSGLSVDHPELEYAVYKNEIECDNGRLQTGEAEDRDDNGFAGDCMGWDFSTSREVTQRLVNDDNGHATHMAGIMVAKANNNIGITGISSKIKILPIKLYNSRDLQGRGDRKVGSVTHRLAKAMVYATDMGADVINLSLGWPLAIDTEVVRESFKYAFERGVAVVAAAGNNDSNYPLLPCSYEGVICVGSIDIDNTLSEFSNYGGQVDVLAPGDNILSTYPPNLQQTHFPAEGYEILNGTSFSAPVVSAFAAIMKASDESLSSENILARLIQASEPAKEVERYALSGAPKYSQLLTSMNKVIAIPKLKNLHQVHVNSESLRYSFELPVQNLSSNSAVFHVSVSEKSELGGQWKLLKSFDASLDGLNAQTQVIQGQLEDRNEHSERLLSITISSGEFSRTYKHKIVLVRDIENEMTQVVGVPAIDGFPNYLSVRTVGDSSAEPSFYQLVEGDDPKLQVFEPLSAQPLKELDLKSIGEKVDVLTLWRLDLNVDGSLDYLLQVMVTEEEDVYLRYLYLTSELKPLYKNAPYFELIWGGALMPRNIASVSFALKSTAEFGKIRFPVFVVGGPLPEIDQNPDYFAFEFTGAAMRYFYYEPIIDEEGAPKYRTRVLDTYKLYRDIRKQLGVRTSHEVELSGLVPQSESEFISGELSILVSEGRNSLKRFYRLDVGEEEFSSKKAKLTRVEDKGNQIGRRSMELIRDLTGDTPTNSGLAFTTFFSDFLGEVLLGSGELDSITSRHRLETTKLADGVQKYIRTYKTEEANFFFYESTDSLNLLKVTGDTRETFAVSVDRSSFLPGNFFSQVLYATEIRGESGWEPSIYVDSSPLTSRRIFFWRLGDDGLTAPIATSLAIPEGCRPVLPLSYGEPKQSAMVFQCVAGENTPATLQVYDLH